ncbi:MAG: hypothetical protein CL928_05165, partial [Deltaproteobacteria bacterium]|nr:hypothetical protein [Deltaproteobacteria bacterium]
MAKTELVGRAPGIPRVRMACQDGFDHERLQVAPGSPPVFERLGPVRRIPQPATVLWAGRTKKERAKSALADSALSKGLLRTNYQFVLSSSSPALSSSSSSSSPALSSSSSSSSPALSSSSSSSSSPALS